MIETINTQLEAEMHGTIDALKRDLAKRRTGRANVSMLDGIKVDYYGTLSPLNQVASVQVADPRLITVKPWDKSLIPAIEKAMQHSHLELNPSSDGEMIRIPIPPLTGERRQKLVKEIKKVGEDAKVSMRNHRRDANEKLKELEKEKQISEDDLRRMMTKVQESTDRYVKQIDDILNAKEKEILED